MRTTLLLLGGLFVLGVFDAAAQSVTPAQRRAYLIETYNVTSAQAEQYETIWTDVKTQDARLCDSRMSAQAFKQARKSLVRLFRQRVSSVFDEEQYRVWSTCNKEIDRYYVLSNEKLATPEQLYALFDTERKWLNERDAMRDGSEAENVKHEREAELLNALQAEIFRVLGTELGEWYFNEKALPPSQLGPVCSIRKMRLSTASCDDRITRYRRHAEHEAQLTKFVRESQGIPPPQQKFKDRVTFDPEAWRLIPESRVYGHNTNGIPVRKGRRPFTQVLESRVGTALGHFPL